MNPKRVVLSLGFSLALVFSAQAQHDHQMPSQTGSMTHDPLAMMGKPTFTQTVNGIGIRLWVIPQEEHKKMMSGHMSGMKHEMAGMDHGKMEGGQGKEMTMDDAMMKEMMAGTHHLAVALSDPEGKQNFDSTVVVIRTVAPSGKSSDVTLKSMKGHFGGSVTLDEKGQYVFAMSIKSGANVRGAEFKYDAK